MRYYTRVEGGDAHWHLYWLPVVTEKQPQEDCGIDRAWIAQGYTNTPMMMFGLEGTVVTTGGCSVKISGILLIILARLCWLIRRAVLA